MDRQGNCCNRYQRRLNPPLAPNTLLHADGESQESGELPENSVRFASLEVLWNSDAQAVEHCLSEVAETDAFLPELYAKVVDVRSEGDDSTYVVRFTSVPLDVESWIKGLLGMAPGRV